MTLLSFHRELFKLNLKSKWVKFTRVLIPSSRKIIELFSKLETKSMLKERKFVKEEIVFPKICNCSGQLPNLF